MRTLSEPCVLIGHSLGSAIVQTVALEKPKNLAALVLIGAGAKLRVHPQLLETIENDFPKAIEVITNWSFHPAAKPDLLQRSRDHMHRNGKKILARDFRACDGFNVMERLKEMQIPTLIICGREDQLTPVKYSEYLKSNLSRAELQIIQNAGHRVMEEQAEQVNHAIQNFAHALSYKSV
jgi:pimeloyl-ACP methyl ester carboxylesterase